MRKGLKKIPVIVYLDASNRDALKALSSKTRVPQQRYLREGLQWVLDKYSDFAVGRTSELPGSGG